MKKLVDKYTANKDNEIIREDIESTDILCCYASRKSLRFTLQMVGDACLDTSMKYGIVVCPKGDNKTIVDWLDRARRCNGADAVVFVTKCRKKAFDWVLNTDKLNK